MERDLITTKIPVRRDWTRSKPGRCARVHMRNEDRREEFRYRDWSIDMKGRRPGNTVVTHHGEDDEVHRETHIHDQKQG